MKAFQELQTSSKWERKGESESSLVTYEHLLATNRSSRNIVVAALLLLEAVVVVVIKVEALIDWPESNAPHNTCCVVLSTCANWQQEINGVDYYSSKDNLGD